MSADKTFVELDVSMPSGEMKAYAPLLQQAAIVRDPSSEPRFCSVCGSPLVEFGKPDFEYCVRTGRIRGTRLTKLCQSVNQVLLRLSPKYAKKMLADKRHVVCRIYYEYNEEGKREYLDYSTSYAEFIKQK